MSTTNDLLMHQSSTYRAMLRSRYAREWLLEGLYLTFCAGVIIKGESQHQALSSQEMLLSAVTIFTAFVAVTLCLWEWHKSNMFDFYMAISADNAIAARLLESSAELRKAMGGSNELNARFRDKLSESVEIKPMSKNTIFWAMTSVNVVFTLDVIFLVMRDYGFDSFLCLA
ncbi:TPA: hypothetical protein NJ342_004452 [Vibrio parahaemolyticus]|nr:hypothetical protein [Vibrio parahaemolyticus]HCG7089190.1 hypothetical protein [Vibrio parahaemolyticus]HCH4004939.1 hypothetical protein [Vibrio parahaemolyticus]